MSYDDDDRSDDSKRQIGGANAGATVPELSVDDVPEREYEEKDTRTIYYLSDSHYYVLDWLKDPSNKGMNDIVMVCGNYYEPCYGTTLLPSGEGYYEYDGDKISIRVRGQGHAYEHGMVYPTGECRVWKLGWVSTFMMEFSSGEDKFYVLPKILFKTKCSPQCNFFLDYAKMSNSSRTE